MNILILGYAADAHAAHMHSALTQAGVTVDYLDTRLFPTELRFGWQPSQQEGCLILPTGRKLSTRDIHSVYWRNLGGVQLLQLEDEQQQNIAFNDAMSLLRTFIQAGPTRWVNSWQAYQFHKEKPLQLAKAHQIGAKIPATIITNNPEDIIEFAQSSQKFIFKPVSGGAHTQFLTEAHLEPQRLELALKLAPVTIQEYIAGTNIRSYVIAESVYSAEIRSPSVDFREDAQAELIPHEIPETVRQHCLSITKEFMMEWTAIDWRLTPSGEYIFLEANPSPMFLHFERQTGFPITQELARLLMN